jgi:hypothetical protein
MVRWIAVGRSTGRQIICLWFRVRAGVEGDIILMQGVEGDTTINRRLVTNQAVMRPASSKIGHTTLAYEYGTNRDGTVVPPGS